MIRIGIRMVLFSLVLFINSTFAAPWEWKTFTSAKEMRQIFAADTSLWCATNGGVLRYDVISGKFSPFINTDGLTGNDVLAVEKDQRGRVWVAISDGTLNIFNPETGRWSIEKDYIGYIIHDLYAFGDSIFVAFNQGISLYDARRWEVKETYRIGEINQLTIIDNDIWAAGKTGVRKANLNFPNLMAPSAWTSYTTENGLKDDVNTSVRAQNGLVFIGSKTGIAIYNGTNWLSTELDGFEIRDLAVWQGQLIALTKNGMYVRKASALWEQIGGAFSGGVTLAVDGRNTIWVGMQKDGLLYYDAINARWKSIIPDGPGDNKFTDLVFDHTGNLWTASPSAGISRFDGKRWQNFSMTDGILSSNLFMDISVDSQNRVWAASWGGGVYIFSTINDSIYIDHIDSHNGLSGITINPDYVVITKLMPDDQGNMWMLNYQAANLQVLAVIDDENKWQYFSTRDGIKSSLVTALETDYAGRKWVGTQDMGITVLDDNGTPFNKEDDNSVQGLGVEDGLTDLNVRTLAFDRDGIMWIGTPDGLFYWFDGQVKPRYSLINDNINLVAVDVRNNKWIGTGGGLTVLDADGFTMQHYSTSNSPLVNDNITCFAFDDQTGYAFIGTTNGLSRIETMYTRPAQDLSLLYGFPNPFILNGQNALFHIENLAAGAYVRIYTPEGRQIRHIPASQIYGARVNWDGQNDKGELVSSGIYLYLVTTESGLSKAGKVAVIRP